ncbi:MAG: Xaa-Pro peptidase family protein [Lapillicoccus sp.]
MTSGSAAPGPATSVLRRRLARARQHAGDVGIVLAPGADLRYLLGRAGGSHERLTALVLPLEGPPAFVVPALEAPGFADLLDDDLGVEVVTWVDGQDPYAIVAARLGSVETIALGDALPALHVLPLRDELPSARQVLAGPIMRELRMRKDGAEIDALRAAGAAIDRVHARVGEWLRPGRTEAEVGADIAAAIVEEGHTRADFVIVASGPHGASPHHEVSDRVITTGDVVVVDIGGPTAAGYYSDSTRTYAVGPLRDRDVADAYAVLEQAQAAAVAAVRPGVTAHAVDAAARDLITAAGYGEFFIHRTGHGIGLEVHEEPYIVAGNDLVLETGMAFSIEPGIYQPGRWGARIEDIVVVTADGVESLNHRPHGLEQV